MDKFSDESLNQQAETVVGPSVKIQGDLNSDGNIKIEGYVTGKVKTSQSVFVMNGSHITADILAGNSVIGGEVQGNIKVTGHLILQNTAKITGDISCQILRVEDGAQFTGKCTMNPSNGNGKKAVTPTHEEPESEE